MADEMTNEEAQAQAERYFTELVAVVFEDNLSMTLSGTDLLLDLMTHFVLGGNVYNFKDMKPQETLSILAVVWADCQRYVNSLNESVGRGDVVEE